MRRLQLGGHVTYLENDLSPLETNLSVKIFLGSNFKRDPQLIALDEESTDQKYAVLVEGLLSRRAGHLSTTARLSIASFAITDNEFGAPCYIDTGTAHVQLVDVQRDIAKNGVFEHVLPFTMHTVDNLVKGKIRLTLDRLDMGGIQFAQVGSLISANVQQQGRRLMEYIQSTMKLTDSMDDTIPGTDNIKAPYDISENGMEYTEGVPLPFFALAKYETPESNVGFWNNALEVVMKRENQRPEDYMRMDHTHQSKVMALLNCFVAQYLDYIGDHVDRNTRFKKYNSTLKVGAENMGALGTWSGDCEDTAIMVAATFDAMAEVDFTGSKYAHIFTHILNEIQVNYVPMMSLDVVHGAKVADNTQSVGAHLNTMLIPVRFVREALERHPSGKELSRRVRWPDISRAPEGRYETNRPTLASNANMIQEVLPTLTGEGTGKFDPLGMVGNEQDDIARERTLIYRLKSLEGLKKDLVHGHGEASQFYMGHLMCITRFFMKQGIPVGSFIYGTLNEKKRAGCTRGAYYTDLVAQDERITFIPHPPVPTDIMEFIDDVCLNRTPPNKFILDENANLPVRNALLDKLVATDFSKGRIDSSKGVSKVQVLARPHQLSESGINELIQELHYVNGMIKVTYELEPITNTIHGYRILFHVQKQSE